MESRLPKRKLEANDRARTIAANRVKFGEAFPRIPLQMNNGNPPLFQSTRFRQHSPDVQQRKMNFGNFESRRLLRRSRSVSDLGQHMNTISCLKRGAAVTVESIPAKVAKTVPLLPSKSAASAIPSSFRRPAPTSSSTCGVGASGKVVKPKTTKPVSAVAAKVSVKRIPAYDYKARFTDLSEKHKVLKEKLAEALQQGEDYESMEETVNELQAENEQLKSELNATNRDLKKERLNIKEAQQSIKSFQSTVAELEKKKNDYMERVERLTSENQTIKPELEKLKKAYSLVVSENCLLKTNAVRSEEILFESNLARKQLHNDILDLKGNIRVFCRVRPPLDCEKNRMICGWQYMDDTSVEISLMEAGKKQQKHDFSFDQVFHPESLQEDIFELVSPLIQSAFDGYNVCIFAYGQTGSGKTYTMEGSNSKLGIIPRTVDLLFDSMKNYKHLGWTYSLSVTFLEIYNEVLYDLLSTEQKDLEIRMVDSKNPHDITVSNLSEFTVDTGEDLSELIDIARSNRATAATIGNERSSRSHAVTQIKLTGIHVAKGEKCIGKINLIDLAGSESPKTSNRMDETKNINRSLSELTNVIMALLHQNDHVPYRNSKLTHLLMPSLGGNSKTLMFINVAPFEDCYKESVKSLRFAASVNACKMTKVKKNKVYVDKNHQ